MAQNLASRSPQTAARRSVATATAARETLGLKCNSYLSRGGRWTRMHSCCGSGNEQKIFLTELAAFWTAAKLAPPHTAIGCDYTAVLGALRRAKVFTPLLLHVSR